MNGSWLPYGVAARQLRVAYEPVASCKCIIYHIVSYIISYHTRKHNKGQRRMKAVLTSESTKQIEIMNVCDLHSP